MERFNVFSADARYDEDDPEGYNAGYNRFGPAIGATRMGATVYELPPGQSICPYHYEFPDEEWALVLEGRPTLRHPEGEDELGPGDVVCFPPGPEGAHKFTNQGEERVRVMLLSTKADTAVAVYPDSDKLGVWWGPADDRKQAMLRNEDGDTDYWLGET
jgi:uncharacterized cupin superfamily protein